MKLKKEVIIAGGGLAGLSLGVALRRRGVPVRLCEAGRYPRHRVCGEFISGVAEDTLMALGVMDDLADAARHRAMRWFREGRELLQGELPESAWAISRWRLDQRLRDRLVAEGGEVEEGARQRQTGTEGLVWAAGRVPQRGRWIGLKCHLLDFPMEDGLEMHMGRNGYFGLTPVENGRVNLCGLFEVDRCLKGKGRELLRAYLSVGGHGEWVRKFDEVEVDADSFSAVAGFQLGWQRMNPEGSCVVGDAAGMIPPFTGNGMSMAFESAAIAVDPLVDWASGRVSWGQTVVRIDHETRLRFRRRLRHAMALHPFLLRATGQRLLEAFSRCGLVPIRPLVSLIR
ncbi:MAG: NAD(P)/FAD-dependent oxidoreductase [Verrucomicrobiales bacterium]